jgi:hypothetical protein
MNSTEDADASELEARLRRDIERIDNPDHPGRPDALADREHLIRDAHDDGKSVAEIAKMSDMTEDAVRQILDER